MSLPTQRIFPGRLKDVYQREVERLISVRAIEKLWGKHAGLWTADPEHQRIISNRLGWIGVLDAMRRETPGLVQFAAEVRNAGLRDIVLLGMGGSSLASEVFSLTFPEPGDGRRFFVLDSTDPAAILSVERAINFQQVLFIVASKSGKTIETLSQFAYFHERLNAGGVRLPGDHFIAITDAGSHLEKLAAERRFRRTYLNPADIGGRYSAHSYFGLVPAVLWGVDVGAVLDAAAEMRATCGPLAPAEGNSGLALGALMGAAAQRGADKLILLSTAGLVSLGNWIEQLVAESTGKEGKGILPVAGEIIPVAGMREEGCVVVTLCLEGEGFGSLQSAVEALKSRGVPVVEVHLPSPVALGGEFFKWEVATAVAGAALGIDPFDEPNVQESKDNTTRILERFQSSGQMPLGTPALTEAGIELYADGSARQGLSNHRLSRALAALLAKRKPGDYLALLAYVERNASNARRFEVLRARLFEHLRLPVLLGFGPRYLHSSGQLFKGGPAIGMFVLITAAPAEGIAIPGANYTFGQLEMAQALGDLESLVRRGKPAVRLHLTDGVNAGLAQLSKVFDEVLAAPRPAALGLAHDS